MQLGIIYSYDEDSFKRASQLGLSFLEICYNVGNDIADLKEDVGEIKANIAKYGVAIGSMGRWGSDKVAKDGSLIEEEVAVSRALIDIASELGCKVFNTGVNYVEEISFYANVSAAIKYLQGLVDYAADKGVTVATYNCRWNNYVCEPVTWRLIHGHIPQLGIKYDPTHCINEGSGDYLGETKEWGGRFAHVHIKGTLNVNGEHVDDPPAGLDMIDWRSFFGLLYKHGYDGTFAIEPHSSTWRGELGDKGVEYTVKYIKPMMLCE